MTEELKVYITAEISKLKSELDKGKKEVEDFGKKGKVSFQEFSDEMTKAGDFAKKGLAVTGAAIAGAATALLALGASTKEYRVAQAKLTSAFEAAGSSATDATYVYEGLYRTLGDTDRAVEASNHLAKLTTNSKDLGEWTWICQGIYATFGDSLPIEGLTEAANETARVGAVTGPLADALNWAGVSEDEFNAKLEKCTSTQEREKLIRETLNGLYSEAAGKYEENASGILAANEAQERLNKATAELGEVMAPINTMLTEFGAEILAEITPYITEFADKYGPQIKETLTDIAKGIGEVITWLADNWELVSTIGTIILIIAAALSVFSTAMGIVNFVMAASPVTWIVLGIVAALTVLTTIIVLVIKHWDEIKEAVGKAAKAIGEFVTGMVDGIKQKFEEFKKAATEKFEAAKQAMTEKAQAAKDAVVNKFTDIKDGITNKLTEAKNKVTSIFTNIKNGITEKITEAKNKVSSVVDGIKGLFNFEFKLPKIKTPSFSIKPSGWSVGDLLKGSIPKLSVKWNAVGGVFESPTILRHGNSLQGLAEDGAEAIVPLEKNTQWLDKIADKLSARQANTPVVLNVDGKVFAQTAISTINENTRQTGSLKLNIM